MPHRFHPSFSSRATGRKAWSLAIALFCGLWLGIAPAQAQAPTQPVCQNQAAPVVDIYYVNGVTTSLDEARINAGKLEQEFVKELPAFPPALQTVCYIFRFNYNPTHGELKDFAEAGQQRFNLDPSTFWKGLDSVAVLQPLVSTIQGPMTNANQIDAATIQRHAARYRESIAACRRVLVVPHSQGNLYTNAAYDLTFGPAPVPPPGTLKIVGVATPDSQVKGNGRYRTSSGDLLIKAIQATLSNTEPANTNWGESILNSLFPVYSGGHSFIGYLSFNPSRREIMDDIRASLQELLAVNPCP